MWRGARDNESSRDSEPEKSSAELRQMRLRTDVNRYIGVDGLHATEAGYTKIADTFFQAIQASLEVR